MAPFDEVHLAHATAPALLGPWTKQPFALSAEPTRSARRTCGRRTSSRTTAATGCSSAPAARRRTSTGSTSRRRDDCGRWTRHPAQPARRRRLRGARPDGAARRRPVGHVLHGDRRRPTGGHHIVAAAESARPRALERAARRLHATRWRARGPARPSRRSSSSATGGYYLFIGPDWEGLAAIAPAETGPLRPPRATAARRCSRSDDPLSFDAGEQVGFIDAHAAEVIVDDDGS